MNGTNVSNIFYPNVKGMLNLTTDNPFKGIYSCLYYFICQMKIIYLTRCQTFIILYCIGIGYNHLIIILNILLYIFLSFHGLFALIICHIRLLYPSLTLFCLCWSVSSTLLVQLSTETLSCVVVDIRFP